MLQIKTFTLPNEEKEANAFLATHKPTGEIARMGELLFIGYDDGTNPPEYQIADLQQLLLGNKSTRLQHEIALHVMQYERADLNPRHNKPRYEQLSEAIANLTKAMSTEEEKAAFVEQRIKELQNGGNTTSTVKASKGKKGATSAQASA